MSLSSYKAYTHEVCIFKMINISFKLVFLEESFKILINFQILAQASIAWLGGMKEMYFSSHKRGLACTLNSTWEKQLSWPNQVFISDL